ncbi:MAG: TRAP transporter substrate-binding protein [Thalassobaculum sp.]|uniref:TRAP transporter substrate-binding protein n=1 Tax=Thalassobaculum sp. TaxID=2022740 RepID=UPI0032EFC0BB
MKGKMWLTLAAGVMAAVTFAGTATDADAKRVRWKMHSAFGGKLIVLGEGANNAADSITKMSGGELTLKFFEPGALVPGTAYYDPVSSGALDAAFGTPGYSVNKNNAYAFFSAVPFGPNAGEYLAWMRYGGGEEMATEMYGRDNIRYNLCGIIAPESSGWYRKEIKSTDDLRGLKMRFFGLGAKVMEKFGVSTQLLAGGDIYPALELGSIDATEFSMPAIDKELGFFQVAKHNYFPGWHQQSTLNELLIHKPAYDALDDTQKSVIKGACDANVVFMFVRGEGAQFAAMRFHQEKGVTIHRWSDDMLAKFEAAWNEVIADEIKDNEDSKKIWASLTAFRKDYAIWKDNGYLK